MTGQPVSSTRLNEHGHAAEHRWAFDAKAQYLATGDGSTDDSAAINAALLAASADGGTVYLQPGTYIAENLTLYTNVHIRGAGYNATTLKLKSGSTSNVFKSNGFDALTGTNDTGGIHSWSIADLSIDGNLSQAASGGYGIKQYGYGFTLENVRIKNCAAGGIYSEWSTTVTGGTSPDGMEAYVSKIKVHDNGGNGVDWYGPHDSHCRSAMIYKNAGDHGLHVGTGGAGTLFSQIHVWYAGGSEKPYPYYVNDTGCSFTDCTAAGMSTAGVAVLANGFRWLGGKLFRDAGTAVYGFEIGGGSSVSGYIIEGPLVSNLTSGVANFINDAGGRIFAECSQSSGSAIGSGASSATVWHISGSGSVAGSSKLNRASMKAQFGGSTQMAYTSVAIDTTLGLANQYVGVDATLGGITITLPAPAAGSSGLWYTVKKTDASANAVTVGGGGGNIDGAATKSLATQYKFVTVVCDGTNWQIVSVN